MARKKKDEVKEQIQEVVNEQDNKENNKEHNKDIIIQDTRTLEQKLNSYKRKLRRI
jgi:hypothetical protein